MVSRESGSSSHLQHNTAPPSPRANSPVDLTRAQFSYIAQGSQYHSDSYMSEGNVSPPDPQEYLYDESIEVTRFSEKEINESSPTTVYDEECLQVDQNLFDLI